MRLLINCALLGFFIFFPYICFANTTLEALPHHGDKSIISEIESAKHTIKITIYGFTDKKIANALIQQHTKGINVQLLIEPEPYKASEENSIIIKQLENTGIAIHYTSAKFALTHQKTIVIDDQHAMILTGNFTYSGIYRQRNFIVTTDNSDIVKNLCYLFEADWHQSPYLFSQSAFFITSPENSWKTLDNFINNTHQQLDIYALELTDKRIIKALLKQKANIRIIASRSTRVFDKKKLCQHSIKIHRLNTLDQHSKALLRDYGQQNSLAYVGSANLSYPSLSKNREVGILFYDKKALEELNATFEKDWKNSVSIC